MLFLEQFNILLRLHKLYRQFLLKQKNPSPLLYFLMFLIAHVPIQASLGLSGSLAFVLAAAFVILCNFNYFFVMVPFLNASPMAAVLMLGVTLFFCNQQWKVYLFIFAVGDSVFYQSSRTYFLAIFSLLLCYQIHKTLMFRTISDNIHYFVIMTAISCYYFVTILSHLFSLRLSIGMTLFFITVTISVGYSVISKRVERLGKTNPDIIYSSRLMAHHLKILEQIKNYNILQSKILFHSRKCQKQSCFCHSKEHSNQTEYFMRQLYQNAVRRFSGHSSDCLLYENYVDFLLKNNQIINALHFLSKWQAKSFFSCVGKHKMLAKVEKLIFNANSSNVYQLQYQHALEYDKNYKWMAQEINEILKMKLQFWREVGRECPKVVRMQKLSSQIISRMYELNVFYNLIIKKYEKSIYLFDATALYAMYMLSTTNYKQYSELIIKNTSKLLEDVCISENNISQTYSIQTLVKTESNNFIDGLNQGLNSISSIRAQSKSANTSKSSNSKLIINAVSSGLCKVLNIPKTTLMGQELKSIIPEGYKEVHNVRLSYLLDFNSQALKEIIPSKVIHKELKLPIKGANGKLVIGYIFIKIVVDLLNGLTFVSVVKLENDKTINVLTDIDGRVTECEEGFDKEIIKHKQIQRYLRRLKESWEEEKLIRQEKFSLMMNNGNYSITISSPLLCLFLEKQSLKQKAPPIHFEIICDQAIRNRSTENKRQNKIGQHIKRMEKAIINYDPESSTSGSKSSYSAVTIISDFSQINSSPHYRFLQLVFSFTIIICVFFSLGTYQVSEPSWDVTSHQNNPLNDTMNMYVLQMLTMKAFSSLSLQNGYFYSNQLNTTLISSYFGPNEYQKSVSRLNYQLETAFKDSLYNCLESPSELIRPQMKQRFSTSLSVVVQTLNGTKQQNITYLQLLMVYITDFNLMANLQFSQMIFIESFSRALVQIQTVTSFSKVIDDGIKRNEVTSIIVHSTLLFLVTVFLVPLCIILKKRFVLHEKIFDLLAAIDADHVEKEIQNLDYVCKIMKKSNDQNEIMNITALNYNLSIIDPQGSSEDSQMVSGFQKCNHHDLVQGSRLDTDSDLIELPTDKPKERLDRSYKDQNLVKLIKNDRLVPQQDKAWYKRRRSGEFDATGSILDPSKKFIKEHCILYFTVSSFLVIIVFNLYLQLTFNSSYILGKNQVIQIYNDRIDFRLQCLSYSYFLTLGSALYSIIFGVSDPMIILYPTINEFPVYKYYDGQTFYSKVFPNCSLDNSLTSSTFYQKYCEYQYSQVILKGEFGILFKNLVEMRYLIDLNSSNPNSSSLINSITDRMYYMESLNLRLQEIAMLKANLVFDHLIQIGKEFKNTRFMLLMISFIFGFAWCACGLAVLIRMKRDYFREVYIITFLNREMIMKSRQVQSFLDSLAKANSR